MRKGAYALCLPRHSHISRRGRSRPRQNRLAAHAFTTTADAAGDADAHQRPHRCHPAPPLSIADDATLSDPPATLQGRPVCPLERLKHPRCIHMPTVAENRSASRLTRFLTQTTATAARTNHSQPHNLPCIHLSTHPAPRACRTPTPDLKLPTYRYDPPKVSTRLADVHLRLSKDGASER